MASPVSNASKVLPAEAIRGIIMTAVVVAVATALIGFVYMYTHSAGSRERDIGRGCARTAVFLGFVTVVMALLLHA